MQSHSKRGGCFSHLNPLNFIGILNTGSSEFIQLWNICHTSTLPENCVSWHLCVLEWLIAESVCVFRYNSWIFWTRKLWEERKITRSSHCFIYVLWVTCLNSWKYRPAVQQGFNLFSIQTLPFSWIWLLWTGAHLLVVSRWINDGLRPIESHQCHAICYPQCRSLSGRK